MGIIARKWGFFTKKGKDSSGLQTFASFRGTVPEVF